MTTWQYNGEVMYIDSNADVIINDGTITGGWSCNGAGGIHITGGANVTLNNVNVINNKTADDDGGGIVVIGGSVLTMNGGSLSSNVAYHDKMQIKQIPMYGGAIYANDSTVILDNVIIKGNYTKSTYDDGAAIAAFDSNVLITSCNVLDNNLEYRSACSVFYFEDCEVEIAKTTFTNNGYKSREYGDAFVRGGYKSVIELDGTSLTMTECVFDNNPAAYLLFVDGSSLNIDSTDFTDDNAMALYIESSGSGNTISNCKFSSGTPLDNDEQTIYIDEDTAVTFTDCDFGDAGNPQTGSIFGEGSVAMIIALVSLIAAGASVWVNISAKKKETLVADEAPAEAEAEAVAE